MEVVNEKSLPAYLAFGILIPKETHFENDSKTGEQVLCAIYRDRRGDLVYEVRWSPSSCFLTEFFQGKWICKTQSRDLKKAFFQQMTSWFHGDSHPRFQDLTKRLGEGRNIFFEKLGGVSFQKKVYFPEGTIFVLRIPVYPGTRGEMIREKFKDLHSPMEFLRVEDAKILMLNRDGELIHYTLPIADFAARPFELEDAVNLCFEKDLLYHPQNWVFSDLRFHVLQFSSLLPGGLEVFEGDGERVVAYAHLLNRNGDLSLDQARPLFMESAEGLGISLKKEEKRPEKQAADKESDPLFEYLTNYVGVQMNKDRTIFCRECYEKRFGNVIYLGSSETIHDELNEKINRKGTSRFYVENEEVVLCHSCWKVILRIPPSTRASLPVGQTNVTC